VSDDRYRGARLEADLAMRAAELRTLAKNLLAAKGRLVDFDGVHKWVVRSGPVRIALTPSIAGSSAPSWLDIWDGTRKTFTALWFAWPPDGADEVLRFRPGDWEGALLAAWRAR
jgi:hypothetical protein